ncbi:hypothetical protein ACIRU8_10230 [Streptomyces sp. NPDC101175]|uniref:hypothetical protein n=1 Tax=Streptomyces sp. NPDC101175 TaxID=3366123 RepID=UPI003835CF44
MTVLTQEKAAGGTGRLASDERRPECRHWIGAEGRHCREGDGVRHYLPGLRCPTHTPSALQGKPEPQPGPGIPAYRKEPE